VPSLRTRCLFALVACALVPAIGAQSPVVESTGIIRGRVSVPEATAAGERPSVAGLSASHHAPVDRRRVVVYLESAPRAAFGDLQPGRARMDQRNEQFVPRVLAITVGTIVEFPNSDKTFHNVFSMSPVHRFNLGRFPPGRTGPPQHFDKPGIVDVFCDIHSHMSAHILVFSHPFFALSDENGRYEIPNVPAGTYSLAVWSELGSVTPRRVTVPEAGAAEADFQVTREP
jgi:plastocyanin